MSLKKTKQVEPLRNEVAIVGQNGHPNPYFMRLWQDTLANVRSLDGAKQTADPDLDALAALDGTGLAVRIGPDQWTTRSLAAPAAGFTITDPAGIAGNPTFVLANDLAALEALSGTNAIYYRSAADTWTAVTFGPNMKFSGGVLSGLREWSYNFTASGDFYIPAEVAMTIDQGNAPIGVGTLAYEKSTTATPGTFATTTLPATLQAGAWLKVSASAITGFVATHLIQTA